MNNNNTSPGNDPSQGDQTVTPPAQGATTPPSQGDQGDATEVLKAKIAELERDNRKYRTERKQQDDAAAAAEQARLKEQGEFRALAEKHEARVKELEPVNERYGQLSGLVAQQIEAQIKDWPAEVKTFDPGPDAPIEQRLTWLEKSKPLIAKMNEQARGQQPGNSPNPRPATGEQSRDQQVKDFRSRRVQSGMYGL